MKKIICLTAILFSFSLAAIAQTAPPGKSNGSGKVSSLTATSPAEIARTVLAAHGGDKLKKMQTFLVKGGVDVSFQGQSLPGAFSTAFSGDKYFFEIVTAVQQLKQVFDGVNTSSSLPGFSLPPVTSLGFPLLPKIGEAGYVITELPEASKKRKGFRMTTPEGFYTDFFIDEKTSQLKAYESKWMDGDRAITTSVEIDEFMTVDGIAIPKKYAQRFDLGPITAYVNFKAKDIKVNSPIEDSAFKMGK